MNEHSLQATHTQYIEALIMNLCLDTERHFNLTSLCTYMYTCNSHIVSHCLVYWIEEHSVIVVKKWQVIGENEELGEERNVKWRRKWNLSVPIWTTFPT